MNTGLICVQLTTTWAMVGLIWFVQLVHYPLLACVGPAHFRVYEDAHMRRTTWVVAPLMLAEFASAAALPFAATGMVRTLAVCGLALLLLIWLSTWLLQAPTHQKLLAGFDPRLHRRLVQSNWLRTTAWTLRGAVVATLAAVLAQGGA